MIVGERKTFLKSINISIIELNTCYACDSKNYIPRFQGQLKSTQDNGHMLKINLEILEKIYQAID